MKYGQFLIDKAAEKCGSRYRLSKLTGIPQSHISDVMNNKRNFPMNWARKVALIAGVDVATAMELLEQERANTPEKKPHLSGWGATGGAVLLLFFYIIGFPLNAEASYQKLTKFNFVYIVLSRLRLCAAIAKSYYLRSQNVGNLAKYLRTSVFNSNTVFSR